MLCPLKKSWLFLLQRKVKEGKIFSVSFHNNCRWDYPPHKESEGKRWKEDKEVVLARDFHQGWRVKINLVVKDGWQRETHSTSISALTALFGPDPLSTEGEREWNSNRKLPGRFPPLWSPPAKFHLDRVVVYAASLMEGNAECSTDRGGMVWNA